MDNRLNYIKEWIEQWKESKMEYGEDAFVSELSEIIFELYKEELVEASSSKNMIFTNGEKNGVRAADIAYNIAKVNPDYFCYETLDIYKVLEDDEIVNSIQMLYGNDTIEQVKENVYIQSEKMCLTEEMLVINLNSSDDPTWINTILSDFNNSDIVNVQIPDLSL